MGVGTWIFWKGKTEFVGGPGAGRNRNRIDTIFQGKEKLPNQERTVHLSNTYIHTNIHTYIHTYVRTYVHTYIYTYIMQNSLTDLNPYILPPTLIPHSKDLLQRGVGHTGKCKINDNIDYCSDCFCWLRNSAF